MAIPTINLTLEANAACALLLRLTQYRLGLQPRAAARSASRNKANKSDAHSAEAPPDEDAGATRAERARVSLNTPDLKKCYMVGDSSSVVVLQRPRVSLLNNSYLPSSANVLARGLVTHLLALTADQRQAEPALMHRVVHHASDGSRERFSVGLSAHGEVLGQRS